MSAPTKTRSRPSRSRTTAARTGSGADARTKGRSRRGTPHASTSTRVRRRAAVPTSTQQRGRSASAQKAYQRRAQRTSAVRGRATAPRSGSLLAMLKVRMPVSRASFVLLMMALLATGVALTMWLSTQAIADSYRLEALRAETAGLNEQVERLQREVARESSVATLAEKASDLGMVPVEDPARILVTDDGEVVVIGEPKAASGSSGRDGGGDG